MEFLNNTHEVNLTDNGDHFIIQLDDTIGLDKLTNSVDFICLLNFYIPMPIYCPIKSIYNDVDDIELVLKDCKALAYYDANMNDEGFIINPDLNLIYSQWLSSNDIIKLFPVIKDALMKEIKKIK